MILNKIQVEAIKHFDWRFLNVKSWVNDLIDTIEHLRTKIESHSKAKPIDEWHEDIGDCLWWKFPIEEPPYCGSPLSCDFPDYVTHFTKFICPEED